MTDLAEAGPQVDGTVHMPGGKSFRPVRILIDTGAEISMLAENVVQELHSIPAGVHVVGGVFSGEPEERAVHLTILRVHLTSGDVHEVGEAFLTSMPAADDGVDCLLGRDILSRLRLVYDGQGGTFTLTADRS